MGRSINLKGVTVYLSGPMDFLALPRNQERVNGWRARVGQFLKERKVTVLDPWYKPEIRGLHSYGKEDDKSTQMRNQWRFTEGEEGSQIRAEICSIYRPTVHIDLRMVDKSDFLVSFCPTNTYSVGTVHEIALARQQHKPVFFVSPRTPISSLHKLEDHLVQQSDRDGLRLLDELKREQPMIPNLNGAPSIWYMGILDGDYFFDGFGFDRYRDRYPQWQGGPLDELEKQFPPKRPLLPYLDKISKQIPERYDYELGQYVANDDWLIFERKRSSAGGPKRKKRRNPT
jgi:hypothetical protein